MRPTVRTSSRRLPPAIQAAVQVVVSGKTAHRMTLRTRRCDGFDYHYAVASVMPSPFVSISLRTGKFICRHQLGIALYIYRQREERQVVSFIAARPAIFRHPASRAARTGQLMGSGWGGCCQFLLILKLRDVFIRYFSSQINNRERDMWQI